MKKISFFIITLICALVFAASVSASQGDEPESTKITLEYNDYYDLCEAIISISQHDITSYKVYAGKVTGEKDTAVVTAVSSTKFIATGIGTAIVETESSTYEITVNPARLTVMYLLGQSNMDGYTTGSSNAVPELSASSLDGEVYSTYMLGGLDDGIAENITGVEGMPSYSNASDYVYAMPSSLSALESQSLSGQNLIYGLNALTESGKGKVGPDGAIASEWNDLTGDKVWAINVSWSGSYINEWQPGENIYERAAAAIKQAASTIDAEIAAGHFTKGSTLAFWEQGEYDSQLTKDEYQLLFLNMYNNLKSISGFEKLGLISVRLVISPFDYKGYEGIYENGPRWCQLQLAESADYPDIIMASNVNEFWSNNEGIRSYFSEFPISSYPGRVTCQTPQTTADIYSDNVHFSQAAHNENGRTAALNMYSSLKNNTTGVYFNGDVVTYLEIKNGTLYRDGISDLGFTGYVTAADQLHSYYVENGKVCADPNEIVFAPIGGYTALWTINEGAVLDLYWQYTGYYCISTDPVIWYYFENGIMQHSYYTTYQDLYGCSYGVQKSIYWASENGLVQGYTADDGAKFFDPANICTRQQMVIMLWRLAGKPEPTSLDSALIFNDTQNLSDGSKKAIAWAVEIGLVKGYSDGSFKPNDPVSRASTVVMLWRLAGKQEPLAVSTFTDTDTCSEGVMRAINWASALGITQGSSNGDGTYSFAPYDNCQRQHIATFLYRYAN